MATDNAMAAAAFQKANQTINSLKSPESRPRSVIVPLSEGQYTIEQRSNSNPQSLPDGSVRGDQNRE